MSKTYKNPNKEKRIKRAESDSHEERRNVKKLLDEIDDYEELNQTLFDKRLQDHPAPSSRKSS